MSADRQLERHDAVYHELAHRVAEASPVDPEATLRWISAAAGFASRFHTGRYADGRLENPALEVGRTFDGTPAWLPSPEAVGTCDSPRSGRTRRLLHVVTKLPSIGGHSRLVLNWMRNDRGSRHSLVTTQGGSEPVPEPIAREVTASGGTLIRLPPGAPLRLRAGQLRRLAELHADLVVLHHYAGDVVPVAAFASGSLPPVAVMNHADHIFWIGASVADSVLCIRGWARRLAGRRRWARRTDLLPIPLHPSPPAPSRADARRRLGVDPRTTMLLTMGSAYKFSPSPSHDFFATALEILSRNPRAQLFVVGIPPEAGHRYTRERHPRLQLIAPVEDPIPYEAAADIILEPFPYGSMTAVLETVALGAYPVLMYAPTPQLDISEDPGLRDLVAPPATREEYLDSVSEMIRSPGLRRERAEEIRRKVVRSHSGPVWQQAVGTVLAKLAEGGHRPGPLAETQSERLREDIELVRSRSVQVGDLPLLFRAYQSHYPHARTGEALSLFLLSWRRGETEAGRYHLTPWLRLMARTAVKDLVRPLRSAWATLRWTGGSSAP